MSLFQEDLHGQLDLMNSSGGLKYEIVFFASNPRMNCSVDHRDCRERTNPEIGQNQPWHLDSAKEILNKNC